MALAEDPGQVLPHRDVNRAFDGSVWLGYTSRWLGTLLQYINKELPLEEVLVEGDSLTECGKKRLQDIFGICVNVCARNIIDLVHIKDIVLELVSVADVPEGQPLLSPVELTLHAMVFFFGLAAFALLASGWSHPAMCDTVEGQLQWALDGMSCVMHAVGLVANPQDAEAHQEQLPLKMPSFPWLLQSDAHGLHHAEMLTASASEEPQHEHSEQPAAEGAAALQDNPGVKPVHTSPAWAWHQLGDYFQRMKEKLVLNKWGRPLLGRDVSPAPCKSYASAADNFWGMITLAKAQLEGTVGFFASAYRSFEPLIMAGKLKDTPLASMFYGGSGSNGDAGTPLATSMSGSHTLHSGSSSGGNSSSSSSCSEWMLCSGRLAAAGMREGSSELLTRPLFEHERFGHHYPLAEVQLAFNGYVQDVVAYQGALAGAAVIRQLLLPQAVLEQLRDTQQLRVQLAAGSSSKGRSPLVAVQLNDRLYPGMDRYPDPAAEAKLAAVGLTPLVAQAALGLQQAAEQQTAAAAMPTAQCKVQHTGFDEQDMTVLRSLVCRGAVCEFVRLVRAALSNNHKEVQQQQQQQLEQQQLAVNICEALLQQMQPEGPPAASRAADTGAMPDSVRHMDPGVQRELQAAAAAVAAVADGY
ncbi:hypothetical protein COO60DRAFT_1641404 [Scenedesmus sp. NREL 46B-D3]|nr:hypothetical protein COO60DRAFT_1641404 [Scenedesmus sp. NREL 46B-D3]